VTHWLKAWNWEGWDSVLEVPAWPLTSPSVPCCVVYSPCCNTHSTPPLGTFPFLTRCFAAPPTYFAYSANLTCLLPPSTNSVWAAYYGLLTPGAAACSAASLSPRTAPAPASLYSPARGSSALPCSVNSTGRLYEPDGFVPRIC